MRKNKVGPGGSRAAKPKRRRRVFLCGLLITALLALGGYHLFSNELEVTFYHLYPQRLRPEKISVLPSCQTCTTGNSAPETQS